MSCAFTCGFLRNVENAIHPAPSTAVVVLNTSGGLVAGSTCTTIGQSSVKLPTFTLKNVRLEMTRCHSPLYMRDMLSCARTDSGGMNVDRPRFGFCLRPCWK